MKHIRLFPSLAALALAATALTSCSDDNDKNEPTKNPGSTHPAEIEVNPSKVFTQGVPTQVGDLLITCNEKGQVVEIRNGDEVTRFNYTPATSRTGRPTDYDMTMTVEWGNDPDGVEFFIRLNKQGFIEYAFEEDEDEQDGLQTDEWWFTYNDNGQLIEMKRTEGDNEVTTITYNADGDIVKVAVRDDEDGPKMEANVGYTDALHPTPLINKSGIMLYDDSFRIDMDEMAPAYFAGLLGKGTAHLPLTNLKISHGEQSDYSFTWILNPNEMPVSFTSSLTTQWGTETDDPVIFRW